jgi:hypothetical protein
VSAWVIFVAVTSRVTHGEVIRNIVTYKPFLIRLKSDSLCASG